ncbi:MAG TPA: 6-carboxytetrahydropterin synthase [Longimicrobiales bacterium]|nr:6-carboxytetrahydropterin synthase [Longimicrobiales bacterium]
MSDPFLTRRVRFAAAHRYYRDDWSDERNREVFGACANPHGHGHNYRLDVTVQAPVDPHTGFSADLAHLDAVLHEEVAVPLDHQHLNHAVAEFGPGGAIPTCENIVRWLWPRIAGKLEPPVRLHRLVLHEDDDLWVEYREDNG